MLTKVADFFKSLLHSSQPKVVKGGDMVFKAGDGSANGKGGDIHIGPGTYKAGDANNVL